MRKALERINKNCKFIKRPTLTRSNKFLTRIKMSLYGNNTVLLGLRAVTVYNSNVTGVDWVCVCWGWGDMSD